MSSQPRRPAPDQTTGQSRTQIKKPPLLSIERVVVLFTPLFAGGSAWLVGLIASNVPGAPRIDAGSLTNVEIAAVVGAVAAILKWLHGRQIPGIKDAANSLDEILDPLIGELNKIGVTPEIEAVIRAEIERLAAGLHAPAVQEVVDQVLAVLQTRLTAAPPAPAPVAQTAPAAGA